MFFPEKIKSIKKSYKVLEVGPGGRAHPRADVLLEKKFASESEAKAQRGHTPKFKSDKKLIFYDGLKLPFEDNEFDYVICSHVLEHIQDVNFFIGELQRIAPRGYLEYPTIYYDYIYNFPEHMTFLLYREGCIYYMSKEESGLNQFLPVNQFFYETLKSGHESIIAELKPYFFQGFEWFDKIKTKKAVSLHDVTFDMRQMTIPKAKRHFLLSRFKNVVKKLIK